MRSLILTVLTVLQFAAAAAESGIRASSQSGLYSEPVRLSLTEDSPGASIRFTSDGSVPTIGTGESYRQPLIVTNTMVLRAAAFVGGTRIGHVLTRSFIFPRAVLHQKGEAFPTFWGFKEGKKVVADYEMDPEIVLAREYKDEGVKSLSALPSLSVVLPTDELFGTDRGIYAHPEEVGDAWERACSMEWIDAGGSTFQVDCGIRIQGGWNRRPEESPKHSFRFVFKKKYGPGKLHYPVFGKGGPKEFDSLILRAGCNNSWLHWSGEERRRGDLIRDQWMRDSFREMGHPSAAGSFVHLYLNGLYWGIYNLTERPDAAFAASHFGGAAHDYDSFNADKLLEGNRQGWAELMGLVKNGTREQPDLTRIRKLLDLESFADFMLLNLYGANADWDRHSNWYAARRRVPPEPFVFFVWDGERTLERTGDNTIAFSDEESPPGIFHSLIAWEGFRKIFEGRVRRHLRGDGALTPGRCLGRYRHWSDQLDGPMIAESARWGDYRRDVHSYKEGPYELYTRNDHWRPEVSRLIDDYFPKRTAVFLKLLAEKGLSREN